MKDKNLTKSPIDFQYPNGKYDINKLKLAFASTNGQSFRNFLLENGFSNSQYVYMTSKYGTVMQEAKEKFKLLAFEKDLVKLEKSSVLTQENVENYINNTFHLCKDVITPSLTRLKDKINAGKSISVSDLDKIMNQSISLSKHNELLQGRATERVDKPQDIGVLFTMIDSKLAKYAEAVDTTGVMDDNE